MGPERFWLTPMDLAEAGTDLGKRPLDECCGLEQSFWDGPGDRSVWSTSAFATVSEMCSSMRSRRTPSAMRGDGCSNWSTKPLRTSGRCSGPLESSLRMTGCGSSSFRGPSRSWSSSGPSACTAAISSVSHRRSGRCGAWRTWTCTRPTASIGSLRDHAVSGATRQPYQHEVLVWELQVPTALPAAWELRPVRRRTGRALQRVRSSTGRR